MLTLESGKSLGAGNEGSERWEAKGSMKGTALPDAGKMTPNVVAHSLTQTFRHISLMGQGLQQGRR